MSKTFNKKIDTIWGGGDFGVFSVFSRFVFLSPGCTSLKLLLLFTFLIRFGVSFRDFFWVFTRFYLFTLADLRSLLRLVYYFLAEL
jgi:hypothetical protein